MKALEQVKDEVAQSNGFESWYQIMAEADPVDFIDEIAIAYAKEAIKEAAERAKIEILEVGVENLTQVNK